MIAVPSAARLKAGRRGYLPLVSARGHSSRRRSRRAPGRAGWLRLPPRHARPVASSTRRRDAGG